MKVNPFPLLQTSVEPWISYCFAKRFCSEASTEVKLSKLKNNMVSSSLIKSSIQSALEWESSTLKRHNDATHPIHSLELLSEFGLTKEDSDILDICKMILNHQTEEGVFQTNITIPTRFKGTGEPSWEWMSCDFPILIFFLSKMGFQKDPRLIKAVNFLNDLVRENGFGCHSSIAKFRGPGRKDDHCPYANLIILKALADFSDSKYDRAKNIAIQAQLDFWKNREKRKIFLFGMGTDFKKLKYPNVYYNIVHVLDVLSLFENARSSEGFQEMLNIVNDKQKSDGGFIPESIWRAYNKYDFGQKKVSSATLTYKITCINDRCRLIPSEWIESLKI